jgi:hypothetical protein
MYRARAEIGPVGPTLEETGASRPKAQDSRTRALFARVNGGVATLPIR